MKTRTLESPGFSFTSLNKDAKLWVRVLRDSLADSLNLDSQSDETAFNSYSLKERCSLFITSHKEAIKKLEEKAFEMMEKLQPLMQMQILMQILNND
jgi:hypothetical protein